MLANSAHLRVAGQPRVDHDDRAQPDVDELDRERADVATGVGLVADEAAAARRGAMSSVTPTPRAA